MAPAWNPSPWEVQAGEDLEFEADFARCLLGEKKKKKVRILAFALVCGDRMPV
jgi:hypothetical protein